MLIECEPDAQNNDAVRFVYGYISAAAIHDSAIECRAWNHCL